MSDKVEQALREYQDAVASQGSEPREPREKSSRGYQATRGAYHSDDVMAKWSAYLGAWAEEGTGAWWAPWAGHNG